jgi:hypothetical protein
MAGLPAEGHAVHVIDAGIKKLGADNQVHNRGHAYKKDEPPQFNVFEIQRRKIGRINALVPLTPGTENNAQRDEKQPAEKERGQPHKGQNAGVGILGEPTKYDGQKRKPQDRSCSHKHYANPAEPVP